MKAKEAPEKIHIGIVPNLLNSYTYITCGKDFPNAVEYTRTDAFIEKACEFLKTNADKHIYFDECNQEWYDTEELIKDFKDYIKGE